MEVGNARCQAAVGRSQPQETHASRTFWQGHGLDASGDQAGKLGKAQVGMRQG